MASLLITGGTGTFGKACIEYLLNTQDGSNLRKKHDIKKIIIFSRDEYKQHILKQKFEKLYNERAKLLRFFVGDVRDYNRLEIALDDVSYVIHAAAMKQVPACEINPEECIKTNVQGTVNVVNAAIKLNVQRVILLSTDKAVEPINIYGACKMTGEKYGVFANSYAKRSTKIGCVRYGNVVASRGSILETFINQSYTDKFTLTDDRMTRFFMLPEEACKLSLYAMFEMCSGGEIFIPKMKSYPIAKLVNLLDSSKRVELIGIRPGEKINEMLINQSEIRRTYRCPDADYYVILPENNTWDPHNEQIRYTCGYTDIKPYEKLQDTDIKLFKSETTEMYNDDEVLALIENERKHVEI